MQPIQARLQHLFLPPLQEFSLKSSTASVLEPIRERVVTVLLRLCVIFGLLSVPVGTLSLWSRQDWTGILIGNISFLGVIILAFHPKLHFKTRSSLVVVLAYAFLFFNMLKGITEFTFLPLFSFVVMTTLLMGRMGGIIAFFISLLTLFIANWWVTTGTIPFSLSMSNFSQPFPDVLTIYTDWIFFVGIFFFTIWVYFDGFTIAWKREQRATRLLAEERDNLTIAFAREQELLEQLSQAHQREIELSRLKSQIITTVSHEFRTPLTVINNSVELLTKYVHNFDEKKREEIQQRIENSVYYLTELLQDASLVNKAYSQGFQANMGHLPFNGLGQRLKKDLLQATNDPANVRFAFEAQNETAVYLDYDFLYRAALNFLTNALKYSPPDQPILIDLALQDQLTVSVSDQGIGLAPEETHHLWELFFRGNNATEKQGLGLGLYLTKRLIQAMDGTVTAVSPGPNQGSTFTIQIPQGAVDLLNN